MGKITRVFVSISLAASVFAALATVAAPAQAAGGDYIVTPQPGCTRFNLDIPVGQTVFMPLPEGCTFVNFVSGGAITYNARYLAEVRAVVITITSSTDGYVYTVLKDEFGWYNGPAFEPCGSYSSGFPFSWDRLNVCGATPQYLHWGLDPQPSWYQSIGRLSATEQCPAGYNPSWAQWVHDGTGGWTCDREQYYDTTTGQWLYR